MNTWLNTGDAAETMVPLDLDGPTEVPFNRFEEDWLERPIFSRFQWIAARYADRCAVADYSQRLSYAELQHQVHALAQRIASTCPHGFPVGILLPHNATFPIAALACLAAGRAYVPIDLKYPQARIEAIVREGKLGGVVLQGDPAIAAYLPADVARIQLSSRSEETDRSEIELETESYADDLAVILYTSGSTGKPKGICNNQRAILQRVVEATNSCHIHRDDRILLLSSPGTIAGEREMFAALLNGATLHITDPQIDGVHRILETIERAGITLCYAVPSLLRMLLRLPHARQAFGNMRVVRIGGDVTLSTDLALFREITPPSCRFFASFSSTETPAVFQWFVPHDWQTSGPRVPIGFPRPGIEFAVMGEGEQPVPPGEVGELWVRSRYLAVGQWQEGCLVSGPFQTDPTDPAMRILRTGDLVKQRADGLWELFGRKDRQIKIRGQRIDAGEVEAALRSCANVNDVAVIARRKGEETIALAAFVALAGAAPDRRDMHSYSQQIFKQALQRRVPAYMHPADIRIVEAIPQLAGFKPDIRALELLDRQLQEAESQKKIQTSISSQSSSLSTPLRDSLGEHDAIRNTVKHAWSTVLNEKSFLADQPWDEADGDSLKAMELWFYIEDRLGFKLPLDAVEENTTPSGLIAALRSYQAITRAKMSEGQQTSTHPAFAADANGADVPLVFLFAGIQDDDPALARFRAVFDKQVRFKLIDYPPWRDTAAADGNFSSIVDHVIKKIYAEPACEIYRVAGYSFGGVIAFEVAQRLLSDGRRVDFLGLIDTRRWDLTASMQATHFHRFLDELPNWRADWLKSGIAALIRQRQFSLLGSIEKLLMKRPNKVAFWFKRRMTRELRYQAFLQWRPMPLPVRTGLFLSEDRWPGEPQDYGWGEICQPLHHVAIGGDHSTVIQSPHREKLCAALLSSLRSQSKDETGSSAIHTGKKEVPSFAGTRMLHR